MYRYRTEETSSSAALRGEIRDGDRFDRFNYAFGITIRGRSRVNIFAGRFCFSANDGGQILRWL